MKHKDNFASRKSGNGFHIDIDIRYAIARDNGNYTLGTFDEWLFLETKYALDKFDSLMEKYKDKKGLFIPCNYDAPTPALEQTWEGYQKNGYDPMLTWAILADTYDLQSSRYAGEYTWTSADDEYTAFLAEREENYT